AESVLGSITSHPELNVLAQNPALLTQIVHESREIMSLNRCDLFERQIDMLLGKWDESKAHQSSRNSADSRRLLAALALRAQEDDIPLMHESYILSVFTDELMRLGVEPRRAAEAAAARLLWKIEKAYSLGIPKKNLAHGESQTEEEYAYGEKYTMF